MEQLDAQERLTAERVARNDSIIREANEGILEAAREHGMVDFLPVVCECADPMCTTLIQLAYDDYQHVRARGNRFLNAPGHHVAAQGWARVVEHHEGYVVVEKIGRAGELAEELDPRGEGGRAVTPESGSDSRG